MTDDHKIGELLYNKWEEKIGVLIKILEHRVSFNYRIQWCDERYSNYSESDINTYKRAYENLLKEIS